MRTSGRQRFKAVGHVQPEAARQVTAIGNTAAKESSHKLHCQENRDEGTDRRAQRIG